MSGRNDALSTMWRKTKSDSEQAQAINPGSGSHPDNKRDEASLFLLLYWRNVGQHGFNSY